MKKAKDKRLPPIKTIWKKQTEYGKSHRNSLRHASITYKLKLNGGDIKAIQGDSGHSQVKMVTDVYSHILDDDRKSNAQLFQDAFYEKRKAPVAAPMGLPDGLTPETLTKMLDNPEIVALLGALAKKL